MIGIIPTFDTPFYSQNILLDGVPFVLDFRYNSRIEAWFFSILDADGVALIRGLKVAPNVPLLARYTDARLPQGELLALASSDDASPPRLDELGEDRRVTLYYFDAEEIRRATVSA